MLLRNDLAGTRRKLLKLESDSVGGKDQREGNVAAVPEWAETNGHGARQEPHVSGCGRGKTIMIMICV